MTIAQEGLGLIKREVLQKVFAMKVSNGDIGERQTVSHIKVVNSADGIKININPTFADQGATSDINLDVAA